MTHIPYAERFERLEQFLIEELQDMRKNSNILAETIYSVIAFAVEDEGQRQVFLKDMRELALKDPDAVETRLKEALEREEALARADSAYREMHEDETAND